MGSRLGSLQLHLLKMGGLATLAASPPKRRGWVVLCRLGPLALAAPLLHPVGHSRGSVDFRLKEWEEAQQWEDEDRWAISEPGVLLPKRLCHAGST